MIIIQADKKFRSFTVPENYRVHKNPRFYYVYNKSVQSVGFLQALFSNMYFDKVFPSTATLSAGSLALSFSEHNCYSFLIFSRTLSCLKNAVFWDVAQCRYCVNQRFGGTYRLHLQGRKIR
jgi:hypothetical protein